MLLFYRIVISLLVIAGFAVARSQTFAQSSLASLHKKAQSTALLVPATLPDRPTPWTAYNGLLSAGILSVCLLVLQRVTHWQNRQRIVSRQTLPELDITDIQLKETQWQDAIERRDMELELRDMELRLSRQELEFKNKALTTYTLHMVQKNSMLEELRRCIQEVVPGQQAATPKLKRLLHLIDYSFSLDKDWEEFKLYFEEVHRDFFSQLKEQYPSLSPNELRLCALLKLNLSVKEMASLLSISPESVKMARHRLRKKLGLTSDQNLVEFMLGNAALRVVC